MPEAIETFADKAAGLLTDRHHGVLLSGTTLMLEICEIEPNTIEQYRRHVPMLCKILRSLLMSGFAPEHDVGGITDPFLQVKVIAARLATFPIHTLTSTYQKHQYITCAKTPVAERWSMRFRHHRCCQYPAAVLELTSASCVHGYCDVRHSHGRLSGPQSWVTCSVRGPTAVVLHSVLLLM